MRSRFARDGLPALGCAVALCLVLAGCDQLDVTSSVEPPSARCASCHLPEYLDTKHPPHAGVKPTTCGTCHGTLAWKPTLHAGAASTPELVPSSAPTRAGAGRHPR